MKAQLNDEERLRRKLQDTVLQLQGNIRVFCRVRPGLPKEASPVTNIDIPNDTVVLPNSVILF